MIKLFIADVSCFSNSELFNLSYSSLPDFRKEKVNKVRFSSDKNLELGAGLILQYALNELGINISNVTFTTGKYGKPYLRDFPDIFFSLSHSGAKVACVVSDVETGCDIQYSQNSPKNYLKIAKRFFTGYEYSKLIDCLNSSLDDAEAKELFFQIWVLKESCIKACGMGLSMPLNSFESLPETKRVNLTCNGSNQFFFLKSYEPAPNYKCAIASISDDFPAKAVEIDFTKKY